MVLKLLVGSEGQSLLREAWAVRCLPDRNPGLQIGGALTASAGLLKSSAFHWAASSLRGEIEGAHNMLMRVSTGEAVISNAQVSEWAGQVATSLQGFIKYTRKSSSKEQEQQQKKKPSKSSADGPLEDDDEYDESREPLMGLAALKAQLQDLQSCGGATSLEELKHLNCWRHLLSDAEKERLMGWRDKLLKAVPKAKAQPPAKKSKPRKGAPTEADLDATARSLFKRA